MYLLILLKSALPEDYRVLPELSVICRGERIVPDITVYQRGAQFVDGDLADRPTLAVEIANPGQTFSELLAKCERLVEAGARTAWIILPEKRQGWTFSSYGLAQATEVLHASPVEMALEEMWTQMEKDNG